MKKQFGLAILITVIIAAVIYLLTAANTMSPTPSDIPADETDNSATSSTSQEEVEDSEIVFESKPDLINLATPEPGTTIKSPLEINGEARGYWFFEASFPVLLTNWDGLIIAEGFATAEGSWMTEEFVPFSTTLEFVSPYSSSSPEFMKHGTLILKKANASGLPENDDALEVPVIFSVE